MRHVAVIDVGKTNAKLALVDLREMSEIAVRTRPNRVLPGPPWPHFDLEGHWAFFRDALREFHRDHRIDGLSVTTHGAAVTLIGHDGRALPMLDYEHEGPDATAAAYDRIRPDFAQTGAPRLPMGLNAGAQLHWMLASDPALHGAIRNIVTYPQYWGYRLTGNLACDVTSLGCHTDLWLPKEARYSDLPDRLGLTDKLAPVRLPAEILGHLTAQVAAECGLPEGLPVAVGLHDSNASLLPHLLSRQGAFSVVSTGTWVVMMAVGGRQVTLDPSRDTLMNVNALGHPVPSARFMGGREFDLVNQGWKGSPTEADRQVVLKRRVCLRPAVVSGSGPFPDMQSGWTAEPEGPAERYVALSYYLALMTASSLRLIGAQGPAIVEGPFARNPDYLAMLGAVCPGGVVASRSATGTSAGAALLLSGRSSQPADARLSHGDPGLKDYAQVWGEILRDRA